MSNLMKLIVFTAPVFAVVLLVFFALHKQFRADFAVENVRFEQQFNRAWKGELGEDPFLSEQKKEAGGLQGLAKQAQEDMLITEDELRKAIEEMDREENNSSSLPKLPPKRKN